MATWCATASIVVDTAASASNSANNNGAVAHNNPIADSQSAQLSVREIAYNRRQQQRQGVRLLLQKLMTKLAISDSLDESRFPYRLIESNYYVCFSHSADKVAVVISQRRAVGIDIESHNIAWSVVQRFYHANEIALLTALSDAHRTLIAKYLWQLKESFIKIHQYKLTQGLAIDYSPIITELLASVHQPQRLTAAKLILVELATPISILTPVLKSVATVAPITDCKQQSHYHIALLPLQQSLVVF